MVRYDNIISKKQCSTPENKKCVFQPYQPLYCMAKAGARFSFPLSSKKTHSYFKTTLHKPDNSSSFEACQQISCSHSRP
ncbi:hypothetical protein Pmani_007658 [Petrolisthes manimaculis]|uniref:Uncharacterized protein n=1 Tax=Petrolisthes manimaculis TaxID=1843537 RepID=A0AAE1Q8B7_9EUCA|nr:hypothetical protein Pmani_007658 [Petrolisthes manimaculis]